MRVTACLQDFLPSERPMAVSPWGLGGQVPVSLAAHSGPVLPHATTAASAPLSSGSVPSPAH